MVCLEGTKLSSAMYAANFMKGFDDAVHVSIRHPRKDGQGNGACKLLLRIWELPGAVAEPLIQRMQMQRYEVDGGSDLPVLQLLNHSVAADSEQ